MAPGYYDLSTNQCIVGPKNFIHDVAFDIVAVEKVVAKFEDFNCENLQKYQELVFENWQKYCALEAREYVQGQVIAKAFASMAKSDCAGDAECQDILSNNIDKPIDEGYAGQCLLEHGTQIAFLEMSPITNYVRPMTF